jgi:hypothetical protein
MTILRQLHDCSVPDDILQQSHDVKQAKDIRRLTTKRVDVWKEGEFEMIRQHPEGLMKTHVSKKQGNVIIVV